MPNPIFILEKLLFFKDNTLVKDKLINRRSFLFGSAGLAVTTGFMLHEGIQFGEMRSEVNPYVTHEQADQILKHNPIFIGHRTGNDLESIQKYSRLTLPIVFDIDLLESKRKFYGWHGVKRGPFLISSDPFGTKVGKPPRIEAIFREITESDLDPQFDLEVEAVIELKKGKVEAQDIPRVLDIIHNENFRAWVHSSDWGLGLAAQRNALNSPVISFLQFNKDKSNVKDEERAFRHFRAIVEENRGKNIGLWGTEKDITPLLGFCNEWNVPVIADITDASQAVRLCDRPDAVTGIITDIPLLKNIFANASQIAA